MISIAEIFVCFQIVLPFFHKILSYNNYMLDYLQLKKKHLKSHNNQSISNVINFKDLFKTKNSMNTEILSCIGR